ncbi:MAG TPA: DNA polymerase III subunit epsilon [Elusimicrobia bacterium]|nr:DNA polymerase III subunit epsilon [Elusimicrobiota bacterium]HBT61087.1 DNA polymerase III subunit epsilon [Elusimicrobiota bacterium]
MMRLTKPVVFFDLETTGVACERDRIVDIALLRREPDGSEDILAALVDPGMPIPAEASAVHHITDAMVRGQPKFVQLAPKILSFIGDADLAGFGVLKFDIPMLLAEFKRSGLQFPMEGRRVVDALTIFHRLEPRNLSAAYKFYCGRTLEGAHRAETDARASLAVLEAQVERYPDLPRDLSGLAGFCQMRDSRNVDADGKLVWRNGQASFNFGKHRTLTLQEVARKEPSYLEWLMGAEKTTPELTEICRQALAGRFPVKPGQE